MALTVYSQPDTNQPPYKKFPVFPPVKLVLADSIVFSKGDLPKKKPVMMIVFSPACDHCQKETEDLVKNIDLFKNVQIIMATMMPYDSMMRFREKYKLAEYKNIIVGQDTHYFLTTFYMMRNLPFHAFYDKKGKLISVFEGTLPIEKVLAEIQKNANGEEK